MATAPKATPESQPDESSDEDTTPKVREYIVLQSAVNIRMAKKRDSVRRILRGTVVRLHSDYTDVEKLIRLKAIALNDGSTHKATTVRMAAAAAGAPDDPARPPIQDVLPIRPSADQISLAK